MNIIYSMDHGNIFPSENLCGTQRDINNAGSLAHCDRICHIGADRERSALSLSMGSLSMGAPTHALYV